MGPEYSGNKYTTASGQLCINWVSLDHIHVGNNYIFPDKEATDVKNYCRNPYQTIQKDYASKSPFCYVSSKHGVVGEESCGLPYCGKHPLVYHNNFITSLWRDPMVSRNIVSQEPKSIMI